MSRLPCALLVAAILTGSAFAAEETWIQRLLRVTGLTAAPGKLRGGDSAPVDGAIWIVNVDGSNSIRITSDDHYRSPIFAPDGSTLYMLHEGTLVRVSTTGTGSKAILAVPGARKIIGFDRDDPDILFLLLDDEDAPIATLSLGSHSLTRLRYDPAQEGAIDILHQVTSEDRQYGSLRVLVREKSRRAGYETVEWTEIYVQTGNEAPRAVSECGGDRCSQPALSPDARRVAFVRQASAGRR